MLRSIIGGIIGGLVGSVIWLLIAYFAHAEIGYIAIGVGFLTGFGVRLGNTDDGFLPGIVAAGISVGAILLAKYGVYLIILASPVTGEFEKLKKIGEEIRVDEAGMIAEIADEIIVEMETARQTIAWPPGVTNETARNEADYPPKVWQQAQQRWNQIPDDKKQLQKMVRMKMKASLSNSRPKFADLFSGWDFLWFGLAMLTAFRVGSGVTTDD